MRRFAILTTCVVGLSGAQAHAAGPSTTLADLGSDGTQAGSAATSGSVSPNGRYVAFVSSATNLDGSSGTGVFLRDRLRLQTKRVSDPARGGGSPQISGDGRTLLFLSADADGARWFRYDIAAGTTSPVPGPIPGGGQCGTGFVPGSISDDGSAVAYCSLSDVWLSQGTTAHRVTQLPDGTPLNAYSYDAAISGDGQWVAFTTQSTNWVTPADADGYRDVLEWHATDGSFTNVSVGNGNAAPNLHSSTPDVSRDGCVAAFYSDATNLVQGDSGPMNKMFVRDRCGGQTEYGSLGNPATPAKSYPPVSLSSDGCRLAYPASGLTSVQLRDRCNGFTQRLDVSTNGDAGNGNASQAFISGGTGRYVAMTSASTNLTTATDANGTMSDVFVRDLGTNTPPVAALTVTVTGSSVQADATASRDPDGYVLTSSIAFGDGTDAAAGLSASHAYARAGTYSVTATVTDADGVSSTKSLPVTVGAPPGTAPPPDTGGGGGGTTPPGSAAAGLKLDKVALSRKTFSTKGKGKNAKLTLRLSVPATVTLTFANAVKKHGKTRYVKAKTVTTSLPAGVSTLSVGSGLTPGKHQLTLSAVAGDGSVATPKMLSFTTTKKKAKA